MLKKICLLALCLVAAACTSGPRTESPVNDTVSVPAYPETRFVVVSDLHLYDTRLGTEGEAFQDYLERDRKLLVLSDEIISTAMEQIAREPADFVLVSGDLTKDGELICHEKVAAHLQTLRDSGKKVFVVPGNHDVNNPESYRYSGNETLQEPGVLADDFANIYRDFGYGKAISRDPASLSYTASPVPGLLLLALDSNRYSENRPDHHPITGGAFSEETLSWIVSHLAEAQKAGQAVIAFLHHGIMEHYPGNEKFYEQYLVDDYEKISTLLAEYGVQLVFTGHFHAQDITMKEIKLKNSGTTHRIFDIETGSLVTAPCPYRVVDLVRDSSGKPHAVLSSRYITSIPSMGESFQSYAADYVFQGTRKLADNALAKYRVSPSQRELIKSQVASAYTAHLLGDEKTPETVIDTEGFGLWLRFVAWMQEDLLRGWWTDLPPDDNALDIELSTGKVVSGG